MTPKRILTTALLSLSVFTIGLSEAQAAQVKSSPDIQNPQLVALKFKKFNRRPRGFRGHGFRRRNRFNRRHRGFRGHGFRRSPSFGHKKFKVIKKHNFNHEQKHHDQKFHHDQKGFFR